jgi:hypothetical protein
VPSWLEPMWELINSGWVGSLLGIVGIGFAIYQIRQRKGPRLLYMHRSVGIRGAESPAFMNNLELLYRGRLMPRAVSVDVWIWNAGLSAIRQNDIADSDPLRLRFAPGTEIVDAKVVARTRSSTEVDVVVKTGQQDEVLIGFAFLDVADGFRVRVIHSGQRAGPVLLGTVIGMAKAPEENNHDAIIFSSSRWGRAVPALIAAMAIVPLALGPRVSAIVSATPDSLLPAPFFLWSSWFAGVSGLATALVWYQRVSRHHPVALDEDEQGG